MKFKGEGRPSKMSSGLKAIVMGIIILSALFAFIAQNILIFIGGFLIAWFIGFVGGFIFHASNAVSADRPAFSEFEGEISPTIRKNEYKTIDERLKRLRTLLIDNLISEEEYTQRKKEILNEI